MNPINTSTAYAQRTPYSLK